MTTLCANHGQQLVAVFLLTALAFGGCVQPQLQQATATSHSLIIEHNEPVPYPAAGYRPKIPFELPRRPKVLFPTTRTTTTSTTIMPTLMAPTEEIDINIETLDQATTSNNISSTTMEDSAQHLPANNYGTPNKNSNVTNVHMYVKVDLNETEVINAPSAHFQPPMFNAAKNFNTAELNNTLDFVKDNVEADDETTTTSAPIADENVFSVEPQPKLNVFSRRFEFEHRQAPASSYGVPNPDIGPNVNPRTNANTNEINANEIPLDLEFNESENELAKIFIPNSNSFHLSASNEALNRLSALKTGHLILLPTDNAATAAVDADILRQIYLANFANMKREH